MNQINPAYYQNLQIATKNRLAVLGPGLALSIALGLTAAALAWVEQSLIGVAVIEALVVAILLGVVVRNIVALPGAGSE